MPWLGDDTRKLPKENRIAPCPRATSEQAHGQGARAQVPSHCARGTGTVPRPAGQRSPPSLSVGLPSTAAYNETLCSPRPREALQPEARHSTVTLPAGWCRRVPAGCPKFPTAGRQGNPPDAAPYQPQTCVPFPKRFLESPNTAPSVLWRTASTRGGLRSRPHVSPMARLGAKGCRTPLQLLVALARDHTGMRRATVTELWLPLPLEGPQGCSKPLFACAASIPAPPSCGIPQTEPL